MPVWRNFGWWFGWGIVVLAAAVIVASAGETVRGKLFPWVIGSAVIVFGVAHAGHRWWESRTHVDEQEGESLIANERRRTLAAIAWVVGLLGGIVLIGHQIAIPGFVLAYMVVYRVKAWIAVVFTLLTVAFLHLVIDRLFTIKFPPGLVFQWLGP